jgi:tetratricopeptide (TPR) repeat protein
MSNLSNAAGDSADPSEGCSSVAHLVELGYEDPLAVAEQRRRETELLEDALKQAQRLLDAREFADAITLLERLAKESPEHPSPHRLLARAYYHIGDFDRALGELWWLHVHAYEHAEFALLRASIALARRQLDEALDQAEYARCLQSPLPAADVLLGEAHFRRGELELAEAAYRRALNVEASNVAALAGLAAVNLRRGDLDASIDFALQALEVDMRLPAVHYRLGLALMLMGRHAEAATALGMATQLNPQLSGPHRWLERIYAGVDESKAADHATQGREVVARRRLERTRSRS